MCGRFYNQVYEFYVQQQELEILASSDREKDSELKMHCNVLYSSKLSVIFVKLR